MRESGGSMKVRRSRRLAAIALVGSLVAGSVIAANAGSSVEVALEHKRDLRDRIEQVQETRRTRRVALHRRIRSSQAMIDRAFGVTQVGDVERYRRFRKEQLHRISDLRRQERELVRSTRERVRELRDRRNQIASWIDSLPLQRCPVAGSVTIADNFGIWHDHGKDGGHVHQGSDMGAATGTPIVAPFDGNAVADPSEEGGYGVKVYGDAGYVYNAHLSAYGKLGAVKAGDVIGYVGMTGNATGPHDHFEWHPGDGAAVDPYMYLVAVC
jgi:murein DD-endopeptidase MepM/ murein hydrolase activator NlpD